MDSSIDLRTYILKSFEDGLNDYRINIQTKGEAYVIAFEHNPVDRTPNLAEFLQGVVVPTGWWVAHSDGLSGDFILVKCVDRADALALRKRLYIRYYRRIDWVHVIKI